MLNMISSTEYFPYKEKLNRSAPLGEQRTKSLRYIKYIKHVKYVK